MIWGRREVWNLAFPLLSVKYTKARAGQGSAVSFFWTGIQSIGGKSAAQLPQRPEWLKPLGSSKTFQWRVILIPYNCLFPPFFFSITSDIAHLCSPELPANSWREHGSHCRQADGEKPAIVSALSADYFHWQLADAEHLLVSQKLRSLLFQLAIQTLCMSCVAPPISRPEKSPENWGLVDFHFCGCTSWPAGQTWCYCRVFMAPCIRRGLMKNRTFQYCPSFFSAIIWK